MDGVVHPFCESGLSDMTDAVRILHVQRAYPSASRPKSRSSVAGSTRPALRQTAPPPAGRGPYRLVDRLAEILPDPGCPATKGPTCQFGAFLCSVDGDRDHSPLPSYPVGASVSLSEAEVHWREFLANLQHRGPSWRDHHRERTRTGPRAARPVSPSAERHESPAYSATTR